MDDSLRTLVEQRATTTDPGDALEAAETIDHLLDERLVLMKTRDGDSKFAAATDRRR